jgi:hypothetical protein
MCLRTFRLVPCGGFASLDSHRHISLRFEQARTSAAARLTMKPTHELEPGQNLGDGASITQRRHENAVSPDQAE